MTSQQNRKLVKANIALFKGERGETARMLGAYRAAGGGETARAPMVLWLDAQTQSDRAERLKRLNNLLALVPADDSYAKMAQQVLQEDNQHQAVILAADAKARLRLRGILPLAAGILAVLILVIVALSNAPASSTDSLVQPTSTAEVTPTPVALPDHSRPLVVDAYTARYPQGILQVTAIEDQSERVVAHEDSQIIKPIPGARFFAIQITFECRSGICDQPPQAKLALQLQDGSFITPRNDVQIAAQSDLEAIALGRTTSGWLVFEVPMVMPITGLVVSAPDDKAFEPITIQLSALNE